LYIVIYNSCDCRCSRRTGPPCSSAAVLVTYFTYKHAAQPALAGNDTVPISMRHRMRSTECPL